jgi:hypothetical protein
MLSTFVLEESNVGRGKVWRFGGECFRIRRAIEGYFSSNCGCGQRGRRNPLASIWSIVPHWY